VEENVIIKMLSIQNEKGEVNESELFTEGIFKMRGKLASISYKDTEATGFDGSVTTITVRGNEYASVVRKGTAESNLILEKNKKHYCYYGTPFGSMDLGVSTNAIENNLTTEGGTLYLKYTIDVNMAYLSENEIKLSVSPIKK
jgi:uncharacterized beta-barrel protein YwiB (DUF1934 family)